MAEDELFLYVMVTEENTSYLGLRFSVGSMWTFNSFSRSRSTTRTLDPIGIFDWTIRGFEAIQIVILLAKYAPTALYHWRNLLRAAYSPFWEIKSTHRTGEFYAILIRRRSGTGSILSFYPLGVVSVILWLYMSMSDFMKSFGASSVAWSVRQLARSAITRKDWAVTYDNTKEGSLHVSLWKRKNSSRLITDLCKGVPTLGYAISQLER